MRVLFAYCCSFTLHAALLGAAAWLAATAITGVEFRLQRGRTSIELQASLAQPTRRPADAIKLVDPRPVPKRDDRPVAAPIEPSELTRLQRLPTSQEGRRPPVDVLPNAPTLEETVVAQLPETADRESAPDVTPPPMPPTRRPTEAKVDESVDVPPSAASQASTQSSGSDVDELPSRLPSNPSPPYPSAAFRDRVERVVTLRVNVGADGRPLEVLIEQSSGSIPHDHSALRTVRDSWRFSPARRGGVPVDHWIFVPIRFRAPRG